MKRLRIFYAVEQTPNPNFLPQSKLWHANFYSSLLSLGHEVIPFNYSMADHFKHLDNEDPEHQDFIKKQRPVLEERLLGQIRRAHRERPIDMLFSYFYDACITPSTISDIKKLGVRTVNFYCNAVHQFHLVSTISPHFDFCMVPERDALQKYREAGANPIHIQMAANPEIYKPYKLPVEYDVTFVGQKYLNRGRYLAYLYQHGIDVRVWGPRWSHTGATFLRKFLWKIKHSVKNLGHNNHNNLPPARCAPPLSDDELVRLYSRSKISLGFSEVRDEATGEIKRHIRLRDFEAPMSGALYFTGYQDELQEYYEIGKEIICYDSEEELLDKVRHFLKNESHAMQVRQAGLTRARQNHTWQKRFQQLFSAMGFSS